MTGNERDRAIDGAPSSNHPLLGFQSAQALKRVLLAGPLMPADYLVEELSRIADRRAYVANALRDVHEDQAPLPALMFEAHELADPLAALIGADGSLERLLAAKERAVHLFGVAPSVESRNRALVVFAVVIAAGLANHGVLLTSQSREEVDQLLAEVAGMLQGDLCLLLNRALLAEEQGAARE